ncbi:MAG: hypothetical protein PF487_06085 [Bacteroidales bacterium]|jgi:hypothetical protein|nr:hypothetical protein [Bacteroidales bacterium]
MDKFRTLSEMMFIICNRENWEKYIIEEFKPRNNKSYEMAIKFCASERDLIEQEYDWSEEEKIKRLIPSLTSVLELTKKSAE